MNVINVADLANEIVTLMENYSQEVTDGVKKAAGIVAAEVNEEIKAHISFNQMTGNYVKAFRIKKSYEDKMNIGYVWYVTNNQYRLTHLLEKGHALRNGGRSKAFPHIIYGQALAEKRMEELSRKAVEDAGH